MPGFHPLFFLILLFWLGSASKGVLSIPIDASLICVPTTWIDVIVLLLENYIAHAGTTLNAPGAVWYRTLMWKFVVIFIPFASLRYTLELIKRKIILWDERDDLYTALAREALLVVAGGPTWLPRNDDVYMKLPIHWHHIPDWLSDPSVPTLCTVKNVLISGNMAELPTGYVWSTLDVSNGAVLLGDIPPAQSEAAKQDSVNETPAANLQIKLPSSRSFLPMGVSIAQLFFSSITLYRTRGGQIDHYGYAAYGLTVFSYTLMSLVNLIGAMVLGEYPYIYVLNTTILQEAAGRGGRFDGCVGYTQGDNKISISNGEECILAHMSVDERQQTLIVQIGDKTRGFNFVARSTTHATADIVFTIQ